MSWNAKKIPISNVCLGGCMITSKAKINVFWKILSSLQVSFGDPPLINKNSHHTLLRNARFKSGSSQFFVVNIKAVFKAGHIFVASAVAGVKKFRLNRMFAAGSRATFLWSLKTSCFYPDSGFSGFFFHSKPGQFHVDSGNLNFIKICWELVEEIAFIHTYTHNVENLYINPLRGPFY